MREPQGAKILSLRSFRPFTQPSELSAPSPIPNRSRQPDKRDLSVQLRIPAQTPRQAIAALQHALPLLQALLQRVREQAGKRHDDDVIEELRNGAATLSRRLKREYTVVAEDPTKPVA